MMFCAGSAFDVIWYHPFNHALTHSLNSVVRLRHSVCRIDCPQHRRSLWQYYNKTDPSFVDESRRYDVQNPK
jgi:hypothetical protein